MKLPKLLRNKNPTKVGDVVMIISGRGCKSGIVLKSDKRKSRVRFTDGVEMFIENWKLNIIDDIRLKNRILRELKIE